MHCAPFISMSDRGTVRLQAGMEAHTKGMRNSALGNIMKLSHRRQFLHLAAGAAALPAVSRIALAQAYPTRPVRVIVPFAPGGVVDILARLMGQWLAERLGQPFITDNRPGAGGNVGIEAVVRA